ncbi:MAG TPA: hypothetical protein VNO43_03980 [Candidatus Eisenbacteria bacterium]|nr:hypothetical protein [Candidatus Eisenbacteria bacterium]
MSRPPGKDKKSRSDSGPTFAPPEALWRNRNAHAGLKLIPWSEIWAAVAAAKLRGNTEMLKVFYEKMYREAAFDDRGVWAAKDRYDK